MDKEMLDAMRAMMREEIDFALDAKLEPIKKDIQTIKHDVKEIVWKVDTLYDWVDRIDIKVKNID